MGERGYLAIDIGGGTWEVENLTNGNKHTVSKKVTVGYWCDCKGYQYRKYCRHVKKVEETNTIQVKDCGYRGREIQVGNYNPETKTFVKHVNYPRHYMFKYDGWGYSENVLQRLSELGCQKLMHIENRGRGEDREERVYTTDFKNYLNPEIYMTRTDNMGDEKRSKDDARGEVQYTDKQRFVNIKHWKRIGDG